MMFKIMAPDFSYYLKTATVSTMIIFKLNNSKTKQMYYNY